jgi:hypothetical protein
MRLEYRHGGQTDERSRLRSGRLLRTLKLLPIHRLLRAILGLLRFGFNVLQLRVLELGL